MDGQHGPPVARSPATLIYDGNCAFCRRCLQFVKHRDPRGRIHAMPYQSPEAQTLLSQRGLQEVAPQTIILIPATKTPAHTASAHLRSAAAVRVLWRLRFPWPIVTGMLWMVPRPLRDAGYRWVGRRWGPLPRHRGSGGDS